MEVVVPTTVTQIDAAYKGQPLVEDQDLDGNERSISSAVVVPSYTIFIKGCYHEGQRQFGDRDLENWGFILDSN